MRFALLLKVKSEFQWFYYDFTKICIEFYHFGDSNYLISISLFILELELFFDNLEIYDYFDLSYDDSKSYDSCMLLALCLLGLI